MKLVRTIGLISSTTLLLAGGVWMGCSSDPAVVPGVDSGTKDTSVGNEAGGDEAGNDSSTGKDAGKDATVIAYDCNSYCSAIATICTGPNQQYLDTGTCLKMCAKYTAGDAGATSGNTLACRVYHATAASANVNNAKIHCPHAGPFGFGQCGEECEDFCQLYGDGCNTTSYGNTCIPTCQAFAHADAGILGTTAGPTLDCREYHLENAYAADGGGGHCDHSGKTGGNVCQ